MSERYVKDILEKLEEIEKLQSKLRTLVPRVRNEAENSITVQNQTPESKQIPETLRNLSKTSKTNIRKLFALFDRNSNICTKYSKDNKWRKLRSNSVDFVKKHWQDKKEKIKNLLSTIIDRDIILVSRAAQTTDNELDMNSSTKTEEKTELPSKSDQLVKKRKHAVQDQLERLLEHFNYSRDPDVANENRVSTHRHSSDKNYPRIVQKVLFFPDEQSETLKIVSSAEKVSINNNKKEHLGRTQRLLKKRISS